MHERILAFGSFELFPQRRLLQWHGEPVRLGSRAMAILTRLAEGAGELISKEDLMAAAWPGMFVEEANVRVQMLALRRALGGGDEAFVTTVPGRGYLFAAPVAERWGEGPRVTADTPLQYRLPGALNRLIGRQEITATIIRASKEQRLVTLVGPGGVGKTAVALAVAGALAQGGRNVCYVDLAALADPSLVPTAVATALNIVAADEDIMVAVVACVQARRLLLLLDNCELLLEPISALAEAILTRAPDVSVLATSRAALRIEGERVQRVRPLPTPPEGDISATGALGYPAVELFVERANAAREDFRLTDQTAPHVAAICRALDGLPLAIELAAARAAQMGVGTIADSLNDRFSLLTKGRRTAAARHQTLRATFDWSAEGLSSLERIVFRRLGAFVSSFDLNDAVAVVGESHSRLQIFEAVVELAAKSLLEVDTSEEVTRYRMLETTRAYAMDRLTVAQGETSEVFGRLCTRLCERLSTQPFIWDGRLTLERREHYARMLPNARAALEWGFGPNGDSKLAIDLAVAAPPMWKFLHLPKEAGDTCERALERLNLLGQLGDEREMALLCSLLWFFIFDKVDRMEAVIARCSELAETLDSAEFRLLASWHLYGKASLLADGPTVAAHAQAFGEVARQLGDPLAQAVHHRMEAYSAFHTGRPLEARDKARDALSPLILNDFGPYRGHYEVGHEMLARTLLCRTLWIVGEVDDAMAEAETCLNDALAAGHAVNLWYTLWMGPCAVAMLAGDRGRAGRLVDLLYDAAIETGSGFYRGWAERFRELLPRVGEPTSRDSIVARAWRAPTRSHAELFAAIDPASALAEFDDGTISSFTPELLRALGEQTLGAGGSIAQADELFRRSEALARTQGAMSWELRTAISRARLALRAGGAQEAAERLATVLDRHVQGRESLEVGRARRLLESLRT
jgi:predicted ATPase/DNA-binding winged helix-turn-helix (wHTH) protein